jgi:hypothetical protein
MTQHPCDSSPDLTCFTHERFWKCKCSANGQHLVLNGNEKPSYEAKPMENLPAADDPLTWSMDEMTVPVLFEEEEGNEEESSLVKTADAKPVDGWHHLNPRCCDPLLIKTADEALSSVDAESGSISFLLLRQQKTFK